MPGQLEQIPEYARRRPECFAGTTFVRVVHPAEKPPGRFTVRKSDQRERKPFHLIYDESLQIIPFLWYGERSEEVCNAVAAAMNTAGEDGTPAAEVTAGDFTVRISDRLSRSTARYTVRDKRGREVFHWYESGMILSAAVANALNTLSL